MWVREDRLASAQALVAGLLVLCGPLDGTQESREASWSAVASAELYPHLFEPLFDPCGFPFSITAMAWPQPRQLVGWATSPVREGDPPEARTAPRCAATRTQQRAGLYASTPVVHFSMGMRGVRAGRPPRRAGSPILHAAVAPKLPWDLLIPCPISPKARQL